jgi:pimeloyl-ACP methyl ester carboxylesterase
MVVLTGLCLIAIEGVAQMPAPLRITRFAAGSNGLALSWSPADSNSAYTVQFQDTLQDGIWRRPYSARALPLSSTDWTDASPTNASRFYRVLPVPAAVRGRVLSVTNLGTVTADLLTFLFNVAKIPIAAQYDVLCFKIHYETVDTLGSRTFASGLLLLPMGVNNPLPLVSYQHGPTTLTNAAPSALDLEGEVAIGMVYATTGYAAVMPDYLGLGDSPGLHPYHHARSEATASVDMLRAARTVCATNGFSLSEKLFLCGYSQGGHATMALLRELETYHSDEFNVTACAAMAGAYDLSGVSTTNFLAGKTLPNPYFFLYIVAAYQNVYHLYPSLADALASPYNTTLPPLLNGNTPGSVINAAMPGDPTLILKPEYLAAFRNNPRDPLRLALQDNDLYRWKPRSMLRMYHCAADDNVPYANSQVAYDSFRAQGAMQVQFIDPLPNGTHETCAEPSLFAAKTWLDSLR